MFLNNFAVLGEEAVSVIREKPKKNIKNYLLPKYNKSNIFEARRTVFRINKKRFLHFSQMMFISSLKFVQL